TWEGLRMLRILAFSLVASAALSIAAPSGAGTVDWTAWGKFTTSATAGTASGAAGSVGVTYSGEVENLFTGYPSWTPASSYVGGSVGNAPPSADGIIQLFGGNANVIDTVTFSKPVTNPIIAIWSLGSGGNPAAFDFPVNEPVTIEAGGPSAEYGGSSITLSGNNVLGSEGNGTIQLTGTFTSISWTTPASENWYGFTVGVAAVPEPATWALMLVGFAGLGAALRLRRGAFARA
ncbi:MAG TPA: PEPxxWA-CTERM sorting domain-containing protein, partial [Caulobacteraceae bacterium]